MKSIITTLLLLVIPAAVLISGCSHQKKVMVDHDYRFSPGFREYSSYAFLDCETDSSFLCNDVQEAIRTQMRARGYIYQPGNASLFVNFKVYYDPLNYKGYDQPGLISWLSRKDDKDSKYAPVNYYLHKGTLMISLIEAGSDELVWRGYASGIFNSNSNKRNYFRNIVSNIFDEYPLLAGGDRTSSR